MRFLPAYLLALAAAAHAQTEVLPSVKTDLKRDKDVLAYARINDFLGKLDKYGEGLFRMDFKVDIDKTTVPLADIRMVVRSDEADHPVKIDGKGHIDLPLLPEAEARTADLATNAGKGKLAVRGSIELTTPPEQLSLGKVRQVMRVARTLREELLPWYLRWLFPRIEAVRICSATPDWQLQWNENGQLLGLPLPVAAGERDPEAGKGAKDRSCALLTGQENWPDAARLVPPAGTRLSIKF